MHDRSRAWAVTGAASGIGRATAELLAGRGDCVFAMDRDEQGLAELAGRAQGAVPVPVDLTQEVSLQAAAAAIAARTSALDGLVNCAGLIRCGALVEMSDVDVRAVIEVNLLGVCRATRVLFPLLQARLGRVVIVSSEAARISAPFNGAYSMSKFALEAYADSLRRELALLGMRVAIVQPGATRTGLLEATVPAFDRALNGSQFARPMRRIRDLAAREWHKAADPGTVAGVVCRALDAPRPKVRYRIGNDPFRRLVEFLPARVADALIGRMMR